MLENRQPKLLAGTRLPLLMAILDLKPKVPASPTMPAEKSFLQKLPSTLRVSLRLHSCKLDLLMWLIRIGREITAWPEETRVCEYRTWCFYHFSRFHQNQTLFTSSCGFCKWLRRRDFPNLFLNATFSGVLVLNKQEERWCAAMVKLMEPLRAALLRSPLVHDFEYDSRISSRSCESCSEVDFNVLNVFG